MKHSTFDQLKYSATITETPALAQRDVRRQRLLRLATLLDNHPGPIMLFRGLEFLKDSDRASLRCDNSPFSIAFADPITRRDGLASDEYGQGIQYFGLTDDQAHHLLCDCHFHSRLPSAQMIACRVRVLAYQKTLQERWETLRHALFAIFSRRQPS